MNKEKIVEKRLAALVQSASEDSRDCLVDGPCHDEGCYACLIEWLMGERS